MMLNKFKNKVIDAIDSFTNLILGEEDMPNSTNNMSSSQMKSASNTILPSSTGGFGQWNGTVTTIGGSSTGVFSNSNVYLQSNGYSASWSNSNTTLPFRLRDISGNDIVIIDIDGKVTWINPDQVTEAAKAFSDSLSLGVEMKAGITQQIKYNMRDSVFADLINIAKEKGTLTVDDLTYLLEASKIVEKLKGPN